MAPPKLIVFDLGNVLVRFEPMTLYRKLLPEAKAAALFARAGLDAMNERGDLNGSLEAETRAVAEAHPADRDLILAWHERWEEMLGPEVPGTADIIRRVKAAGLPVAAFSNFAADTFPRGLAKYPVLAAFDHIFLSGVAKLAKPDPAFYALLERDTGFAGDDVFFVDDKAENVATGAARGWRTHHFVDGASGLAAALGAVGLDVK